MAVPTAPATRRRRFAMELRFGVISIKQRLKVLTLFQEFEQCLCIASDASGCDFEGLAEGLLI